MTNSTQADGGLKARLDFIGFDQHTLSTLAALQPFVSRAIHAALDSFYLKVRASAEMRKLFTDEKHVASAQKRQETHWTSLASARFDEAYVEGVRKIGRTHARIGLEPRWYIGGYALIVERLIHALVKEQWPGLLSLAKGRPEGVAEALSALVKAALLDMDFAISVYLDTLDEQRRRAEAEQAAVERESVVAVDAIAAGLAKLAAKDLTSRITSDLPAAFRKTQQDFNGAIEQIADAMVAVARATDAVNSGAREIASASDELARRTEQQAANLEQTAAALGEISTTVKKSADGANHAREVVSAADEDAKKSAVVVRQAVEAMDEIAQSSQQIGQIIGVIDEIAFQTNLLALNAGVEAARAGDAGRGFAVVASEVRALAQRSAEAAKEIKGLISKSATQVDRGVKLVAETGDSLGRIMLQVAEINGVVAEIANGAKEQSTALAEVSVAVAHVDQTTQQNAAMAEEATAASRAVSQEAERLSELVGQFEVGSSKGEPVARRASRRDDPPARRRAVAS
ncbi:MAG: globin-coupled sensor protein [Roseiarcus sp.]|jgi:methyl-accepting chemotaxis protein